jgi:hypothetical protein
LTTYTKNGVGEAFYEEPLPDLTGDRRPSSTYPRPGATADERRPPKTPDRGDEPPAATAPAIVIDGEELYRVEGDLLLDIDELQLYLELQQAQRAQHEAAAFVAEAGLADLQAQSARLVGILQGGRIVRWAPGTVLRYCVLRQTFPRDDWYEEVVDNMRQATADWAATCGVEFEYVSTADDSASLRPPGVLFPVRHIATGGAFIAAAFFPTDPVSRRRMLIDPSYHTSRFDRVGVLRHELGHVLGFRHEHIRSGAPPVCPDEAQAGTIDLTAYDPKSVTHYFCGGVGTRDLQITAVDRAGSQLVYGAPLSAFELLDE